ncbi:MAG: cytosine permease, partial [Peptostreptococcaceae bacterium]|nr:cytosine permease [Peptostreptococcaceae bacterium]
MKNEKNSSKIEANALAPIPMDQRRGWVQLTFVQAGICVCVPSFLLGALLVAEMPVWRAIISGSLGYVIVVVIMSILGMIATDLGRASCTVAQSTFGESGARLIVSILFAINLIGWFGIQNGLCGEAFANFMHDSIGIAFPLVASNILWGLIMTLTAAFGVNALSKLDYVSIPYLMIVMIIGMFLAIQKNGMSGLNGNVDQTMSFLEGVALSFNFYAVGTISAMDYTRFQKNRRETIRATVLGVLPLGIITLVIGVFLTKIANNYDISSVLTDVGVPLLGATCLILATWTTNSTNAYSAALDVTMALKVPDNRRREVTIIVGVIGTLL